MNKYQILITTKFKKDLKTIKKRKKQDYDITLLKEVVDTLTAGQALPAKYKDHSLIGNYKDCHECHITWDWLLIYEIDENKSILTLIRTGTHSDLF